MSDAGLQMKRICIVGAGAVGGHLAARLASAGVEVSMLARGATLQAIQAGGVRLEASDGVFQARVRASDDATALGPHDVVIVALKAQGLADVAPALVPLLAPHTPVVFAVNGIPWWYAHGMRPGAVALGDGVLARLDPGGVLARTVGAARAIGCVVSSPNGVVAPGVVRCLADVNTFVFGEPDGSRSPRLAALVATLQRGLPGASAAEDIRTSIWRKLLLNLSDSPLAVLTRSIAADYVREPGMRALFEQLMREGSAVAAALGVDAPAEPARVLARVTSHRHSPSMLADLLAGRSLEIDAQVLAVRDLARAAGVATPTLDVVAALLAQRVQATFA